MAIGVIELLFIIFIAGSGLGMFALAAFTAVKGRPGIAALIVGAGLFTALVGVGIVSMVSSFQPRVVPGINVEHSQWTPDGVQVWPSDPTFVAPVNVGRTTWSFALRPLLFICVGVIALLFVAARHGGAHSAAGHVRIWPVFLALPVLAYVVIGSMRYEASSSGSAAARQAAEMREAMRQQQNAFVERQRQKVAQHIAAAKAEVHQQIEQMDIHELMEKFDAPRIVLQAPIPSLGPTSGSATFLIAAATTAAESAKKEAQGKAEKAKSEADADADKPEASATVRADHASAKSDSVTTHKEDAKAEANAEAKAAAIVEAEALAPPVAPVPPVPPAPPVTATVAPETSEKGNAVDTVAKPAAVELGVAAATPPKWINDPPKRTGDVRREVIVTEEYHSAEECYAAADIYLMFKALERLQQLRGQVNAASELPSVTFAKGGVLVDGKLIAVDQFPGTWDDWRLIPLSNMGITPEYLRREIVAKDPKNNESREYLETVTRSFGPMRKLYLQIEFTPAVDRELLRRSEAYQRQERFAVVGVGAGVVLTLLTGVWGLLKIDTVTKGYYTKRLFFGVPAAIIGLIGFYVALVEAGFDLPH